MRLNKYCIDTAGKESSH